MNKEQLEKVAKTLAEIVHYSMNWDEPMDGDATMKLADRFLEELDQLNGNT